MSTQSFTEEAMPLESPFVAREHQWLGKKGSSHYIPSWYRPHARNVNVMQSGVAMGFRVGDVLAHRRWAVQEDGELLPQLEFEVQYRRYLTGFETSANYDPNVHSCPNVRAFVSMKQHGEHLVAMDFDPDAKPAKSIEAKYNQDGEISEHFLKQQKADVEKLARMETLAKLLTCGTISQEMFLRESGLDAGAAAVEIKAAPVQPALDLARPEKIVIKAKRGRKPRMGREEEAAPCGKLVSKGFVPQHVRHCTACRMKDIPALQPPAQAESDAV